IGDAGATPGRHAARRMVLARRRERSARRIAQDRRKPAAQRTAEAAVREAGTVSERLLLRARKARAGPGRRTANVETARRPDAALSARADPADCQGLHLQERGDGALRSGR